MFDYYNCEQRVSNNSVSGTISKTCEKSFFKYAKIGSILFEKLMSCNPEIHDEFNLNRRVVILQSMIIAENTIIFELIWEKDFKELKNVKND